MEFPNRCSGKHECSIWISVRFQQRDGQDSQNLNNDTLCRLLVTSVECIFETEKNHDAGILLFHSDDYFQGCGLLDP